MEAKNDSSSGGGTLPRQQRQSKRIASSIALPPPQPLFNTDYTAEAHKQMSMYYSTPSPSSQDANQCAMRRQSGPANIESDLCQKVEKCFIDSQTVHYSGRITQQSITSTQFQSPFHLQMAYQQHPPGGNYKLYAGQTHQTQAEVHHVEHSQIEVCMVSFIINFVFLII